MRIMLREHYQRRLERIWEERRDLKIRLGQLAAEEATIQADLSPSRATAKTPNSNPTE